MGSRDSHVRDPDPDQRLRHINAATADAARHLDPDAGRTDRAGRRMEPHGLGLRTQRQTSCLDVPRADMDHPLATFSGPANPAAWLEMNELVVWRAVRMRLVGQEGTFDNDT